MRKRHTVMLLIIAVIVACGSPSVQETKEEVPQKRPVRQMNITGEIAKAAHGYIIRGKVPSMIFTILNPEPAILDDFVKSEKTILIEARIISGDNVAIEKIDGKAGFYCLSASSPFLTERSSISNTSTLLGGMRVPRPFLP